MESPKIIFQVFRLLLYRACGLRLTGPETSLLMPGSNSYLSSTRLAYGTLSVDQCQWRYVRVVLNATQQINRKNLFFFYRFLCIHKYGRDGASPLPKGSAEMRKGRVEAHLYGALRH
jgi:hypothetical protein